jgi:hypothetical protein
MGRPLPTRFPCFSSFFSFPCYTSPILRPMMKPLGQRQGESQNDVENHGKGFRYRISPRPAGRGKRLGRLLPFHQNFTRSHSLSFALPAEIRLQILKEALSQSEPIHDIMVNQKYQVEQVKNYRCAPIILRACRQLYHEGAPCLYGHKILDVIIFNTVTSYSWNTKMLSHDLGFDLGPPAALRQARNFNITLYRGPTLHEFHPINRDENWDDRQAVHQLCAVRVDVVDLAKIRMTVNV